jgi:carbonic anhydrase
VPAAQRSERLCELNAIEQAENVCLSTVVQDAWSRGQSLSVHGWVYSLHDGQVRELGMDVESLETLPVSYANALAQVQRRGTAA